MEKKKFQFPHTYIIIFGVILVAALLTVFIPLGRYETASGRSGVLSARDIIFRKLLPSSS